MKSISTLVTERVILSDDHHSKVSIEIMREKQAEQYQPESINHLNSNHKTGTSYITYRFSRKVMKAELFVDILNVLEIISENKLFMRMEYYYFSKETDDIYIFFSHKGENLQELFNRSHFSLTKHEAKSTFKCIVKALLTIE